MTHSEKLQELTADIREKLPRLMELKEGCRIIRGTGMSRELCIYLGQDHILKQYHLFGSLSFAFSTYDLGAYKIIGTEPMLNDVLEWLWIIKNVDETYYIEEHGEIYYRWHRGNDVSHNYCGDWDLSKPYLRDQSEELIDFFHNLIKK